MRTISEKKGNEQLAEIAKRKKNELGKKIIADDFSDVELYNFCFLTKLTENQKL